MGDDFGLWCHALACHASFDPWWVPYEVIVTPHMHYIWRTVSFPYSAPFPVRGSTWRLRMIKNRSLVLDFFLCFHVVQYHYPGWYFFGVVVSDSCADTISHMRRSGSLVNFLYPWGYCSSDHFIYLIIFRIIPTLAWNFLVPPLSLPPACVLFSYTCFVAVHFAISAVDVSASNLL